MFIFDRNISQFLSLSSSQWNSVSFSLSVQCFGPPFGPKSASSRSIPSSPLPIGTYCRRLRGPVDALDASSGLRFDELGGVCGTRGLWSCCSAGGWWWL